MFFGGTRLNQLYALKTLREVAREAAHFFLSGAGKTAHALTDHLHRVDRQGPDQQGDQGEAPFLIEHHPNQKQQGEAVTTETGHDVRCGDSHGIDVKSEMRNQTAAVAALEHRHVMADKMAEQPILGVRDDLLTDIIDHHLLGENRDAFGRENPQDGGANRPEQTGVAGDKHLVDHRVHQPGGASGAGCGQRHAQAGDDQMHRVGTHHFAKHAPQDRPRRGVRRFGGPRVFG